MTISSQSNIVAYNCAGTFNYTVPFYWLANSHLHVTLITVADGTRFPLTEGVDYTATGAGNLLGGIITTTVAYSAAYQIEIKRVVPIIQPDNYIAGMILPAETVEKDFDYGIMVSQQLDQRLGSIEQSGAGGGIVMVNLPGSGVGVYAGQVGTTYNFKKLIGAGDLTITDAGTELLLSVGGVTGALKIVNNLTDVADRQASLNNLTNAAAGGNEYVLTRDTATGNAVWKVSTGGGGGGITYPGTTHQFLRGDGAWAWEIKDAFNTGPYAGGGGGGAALVISDAFSSPAIWLNHKGANANARLYRISAANSGGNAQLNIATFNDDGATGFHFPFVLNRAGNLPTTLSLLVDGGRLLVGAPVDDNTTILQVAGDMRFDGNARRLRADMSTATLVNRLAMQSSVVNGVSSLTIIPNGTATTANLTTINNSDLTAPASYTKFQISNSLALLESGAINAGTILPLAMAIAGAVKLRITPAGLVTINEPTDDGTSALQVNGDLHIVGLARKIRANWSDATPANRTIFQTDVVNGITSMIAAPNGTAQIALLQCVNNSDLTQPLAYGDMRITNSVMQFSSQTLNGGTQLPLVFNVAGIRMRVTTAGLVTIGEPTDDGTSILQLNGNARLNNFDLFNARTVSFTGEVDDGTSGTAKTIAFTAGQYHRISMTGNCVFTFTPPTGPAVVQLKLTQDGTGSRVMTLPAGKWPGTYVAADKLLSTAAGSIDLLTAKWDGAAWFYTLTKGWA